MRPLLSINDETDGGAAHAVALAKFCLGYIALRIFAANVEDILIGKFTVPGLFALSGIVVMAIISATLLHHVGHVLFPRSQAEMIGPDADGVVALVHNVKAIGNWAICNFPRYPMGALGSATNVNCAIFSVHGTLPNPASITSCEFNRSPKSIFNIVHGSGPYHRGTRVAP